MKVVIAVLGILIALAAPLCAETVMVSIQTKDGTTLSGLTGLLSEAYAIEDGVMNEFFDNGHIIFNAGITSPKPLEPPFPSEPVQVRIAKAGGASHLLDLALQYEEIPGESNKFRVNTITYRFINVISGRLLADGVMPANSVPTGKLTIEEIGFILGKMVAKIALSTL